MDNVSGTLMIYTLSGQVLRTFTLDSQRTVLDISDLDRGYYLVVILDENGHQSSSKIVK